METTIEQQVALDEALVPSTQRIPGQSFDELPFEEEILEFLRLLGHSAQIRTLTDVNINKLFQPWISFGAVINKCLTGKSSGFDSLELMNNEIKNTKAYKEYYACATREAAPKPKASARRKRSGSDTSITPPIAITTPKTIVAITPRLTTAAKGKQPAKAKSPSDSSEVARTEAQQLKIVLRRSRQQTHISQLGGSGTYEGTDDEDADAQEKDRDDDEGDEKDESDDGEKDDDDDDDKDGDETDDDDDDDEESKSDEESDDEETKEEESFDPIPRTPEDSEDDGNGEEDQDLRISKEERLNEEEEADELYQDMNEAVRVAVQIQTDRLPDLSEMELKKILIEKMEGNKSIQRSDEQRNLYKALVKAYEADKIILDTYRETVTLKRRRNDESDKDEGPSAGSDRGSKRRREGKEPKSASAPLQTATRSAGRSTTGSKSRQVSASESAFAEEPVQTTSQIEEPSHPVFETGVEDQPIVQSSQHPKWFSQPKKPPTPDHFSNFIMNRLRVDTLTPELLAGPTYELMKGSCKSLTELEYHLEEVYKATTDQLDWEPINYDKHALWGVSHLGRKRQQFYGFAVNRESALDVYSKRRIIAITDLKIVEWHSYKHLDWITVRRNDDKLYKFKEGDFKRIFTRSIVIQRHVEDLQLEVKSYQKRLNLTKPDTYRSDLKRREAYTAYSNPRGFIYQNKDKKNRLMRIDELHKFSDGTLNDVRNALDDRLKGIRMQYLPKTIWRKSDKDRAAAMI
nr:hypothetical protein [Tanacetum cinerariifolium]